MNIDQLITSTDFKKTSDPMHKRYKCLFCHEDKYKLYIHFKKGVYLCFKCGATGKISGEAKITLDEFQSRIERFQNGELLGQKNQAKVELPPEIVKRVRKSSGLPYHYLRKRQITEDEIERYRIGYCPDGRYFERIILPIYESGRLVYFVARSYTNREPRYFNVEQGRSQVIFKSFQEPVEEAVLVEGIFTAIYVARVFPTIASLGKVVSESQAAKIAEVAKKVYVMLDSNAKKECFQAVQKLSHHVSTVPIFIDKDAPDSYSYAELKQLLRRKP